MMTSEDQTQIQAQIFLWLKCLPRRSTLTLITYFLFSASLHKTLSLRSVDLPLPIVTIKDDPITIISVSSLKKSWSFTSRKNVGAQTKGATLSLAYTVLVHVLQVFSSQYEHNNYSMKVFQLFLDLDLSWMTISQISHNRSCHSVVTRNRDSNKWN